MKTVSPNAYVIADYLFTAATRLRIHGAGIYDETREVIARYPDTPEAEAALDFVQAMEAAQAFEAWKEKRESK